MNNPPDHEMRYYPIESLALADDVPGARQWASAFPIMLNSSLMFNGLAMTAEIPNSAALR